jgi:FMN phosphatase YigB (HAD superfamily)
MKNTIDIIPELDEKIAPATVLMFDLDGTLINTNYANFLSYTKAISQVMRSNIDLSYNPDKRFTREVIKEIVPTLSKTEYEKIIRLKNKLYIKYLSKTKLNYSLAKILKKYSSKKNIVLVTNSHRRRASTTLKYHGLIGKFSHKLYRQKAHNKNKFEYALDFLQILPASVVVFENEKSEIIAAIRAGIPKKNIITV